jgi:hypothetical protein
LSIFAGTTGPVEETGYEANAAEAEKRDVARNALYVD